MSDRFDEWKVEISEKKSEDKEETLLQGEVIKWSRKRKIITFTVIIFVAVLTGAAFLGINNRGNKKYTREEQFHRLFDARAYKTIVEEYFLNSDLDIKEKRVYREYIKEYFNKNLEEFEKTGEAEKYDEARLIYDTFGAYVTSMNESELESVVDSRIYMDEAINSYNKGDYGKAYSLFSCIEMDEYLYEQAQEYINKILTNNREELELVIWYTDDEKKDLAKQIEVIADKYKDEGLLRIYDISFEYVFVDESELEEKMKNEAPDVIFADELNRQIKGYMSSEYMLGTDILFVNSDYFNEWEVSSLDSIINKNNPELVSNIYIPLYEKDGFELFMYTGDFFIDQYYEEYRPENGMVMYHTNMRKENSIDVMDMTRKLAEYVYTDSDGLELFKQGKIGAVITGADEYMEMRAALGDKLQVYTLPYYSKEGNFGKEAYFLQGDIEIHSFYYKLKSDKYGVDLVHELIENRYYEDIKQYVWDNYFLCGPDWSCGVSEEEHLTALGIILSRQLGNAEFVYMDDKKLYEERIGEVCEHVMRAGSREEIKAYLDSIEWIIDADQ